MKESTEIKKEALVEQWLEHVEGWDERDLMLVETVISLMSKAYQAGTEYCK